MAAFNADPAVMRWIGDGSVRTHSQTRKAITDWEEEWRTHGFGLFAVEVRASGELAGFTGLSVPNFLPEVLPAVEVGWRLGQAYWGRGFATEAARAALRFGLEERGLPQVLSIHQVGNDASARIMQRLGMRPVREAIDHSCCRPVRIYATTSDLPHPMPQPTPAPRKR